MKVFISWSGVTSQQVAKSLHNWLPYVIQGIKPFMSSGDIDKGERWGGILAEELNDTAYGIICLTRSNIKASWLNFEAGAISKAVGRELVWPFLFNIEPSHVQGPLSQFQSTVNQKEDVFKLVSSINKRLDAGMLDQQLLRHTFDKWWSDLQTELDLIEQTTQNEETEMGVSWMFKPSELSRIELHTDCKSIWVITPSPFQDLLDNTCVSAVVEKNLERGISYTILVPHSHAVEIERKRFEHLFVKHSAQLKIISVADEEFNDLATTHYLILNPEEDETHILKVYLELPIEERDFWVEVKNEAASNFHSRFRKMLNHSESFEIHA